MLKEGSICNIQGFVKDEILPVYKDIILNIPGQIREMKKSKNMKIKQKSPHSHLKKSTKVQSERTCKPKQMTIESKNMSRSKSKDLMKTLKDQLISKLDKISRNLVSKNEQIAIKIDKSDGSRKASCFVQCSFCEYVSSVSYKTSWNMSNVAKHFKRKHTQLSEPEPAPETRPSSATFGDQY